MRRNVSKDQSKVGSNRQRDNETKATTQTVWNGYELARFFWSTIGVGGR